MSGPPDMNFGLVGPYPQKGGRSPNSWGCR